MIGWRIRKFSKCPIGTVAQMGNKLYVKTRRTIVQRGEVYRPWECIKIDGNDVQDGGYISSVELGYGKAKVVGETAEKISRDVQNLPQEKTLEEILEYAKSHTTIYYN